LERKIAISNVKSYSV